MKLKTKKSVAGICLALSFATVAFAWPWTKPPEPTPEQKSKCEAQAESICTTLAKTGTNYESCFASQVFSCLRNVAQSAPPGN